MLRRGSVFGSRASSVFSSSEAYGSMASVVRSRGVIEGERFTVGDILLITTLITVSSVLTVTRGCNTTLVSSDGQRLIKGKLRKRKRVVKTSRRVRIPSRPSSKV